MSPRTDTDPRSAPKAGDDDTGGLVGLWAETERTLVREGARSVRYVRVVLDAQDGNPAVRRTPVRLGLAVDRSGSMGGERLQLAKEAVGAALRLLDPSDSYALVWFDGGVERVVAPARPATRANVHETLLAVEAVQAGGSTALHGGWRAAAEAVTGDSADGSLRRCLLITDGQANEGLQSPVALAAETRTMLQREGVVTSCLGLGSSYNEVLLQAMADACDGQAFHVAQPADIPVVLTREVGDALTVVGRQLELQVRPSEGVRVDVVGRYRNAWTGHHLAVSLGDAVANQRFEVVLRVVMPLAQTLAPSVELSAWSAGEPCLVPAARVVWTPASHPANDAQPRRAAVDRAVASAYAALARFEAGGLSLQDPKAAAARLEATAERIASYAGRDAALNALVAGLKADAQRVRQGLDEGARKGMTMGGFSGSRGRGADGSVLKSDPSRPRP